MRVIVDANCEDTVSIFQPLESQGNAVLNLLWGLGYPKNNLPYVDLLKKYHGLEGCWYCVSPVKMYISHNDVYITESAQDLELDEDSSRFYFDFCSKYFQHENLSLYFHDATTWLVNDKFERTLHSHSPYQIINHSIMPILNRMSNDFFWQKMVTESQMLIASNAPQGSINSLWPWGNPQFLLNSKKQRIYTCAHFFPLLKYCSSNVYLYDATVVFRPQDMLLVKTLSDINVLHLKQFEQNADWYWNNCAYRKPQSWWRQLRRLFSNAN